METVLASCDPGTCLALDSAGGARQFPGRAFAGDRSRLYRRQMAETICAGNALLRSLVAGGSATVSQPPAPTGRASADDLTTVVQKSIELKSCFLSRYSPRIDKHRGAPSFPCGDRGNYYQGPERPHMQGTVFHATTLLAPAVALSLLASARDQAGNLAAGP